MKSIIKKMPKGSIILFGQLNTRLYPGETLAFLEEMDIKKKYSKISILYNYGLFNHLIKSL